MTEFEKMVAGLLYNSSDEDLMRLRTEARLLTEKFNQSSVANMQERQALIDKMIPNHGKNIYIEPSLRLEYGTNITIGDNFFMNFDGQILDICPVNIGNDVFIGARVTIATPVHPLLAEERNTKMDGDKVVRSLEYGKPVTIGDNVWIASGVTICGGVKIGNNVVIGAGSVVTRDIPDGYLAYGVPCRAQRKITEKDRMFPSQGIYD